MGFPLWLGMKDKQGKYDLGENKNGHNWNQNTHLQTLESEFWIHRGALTASL